MRDRSDLAKQYRKLYSGKIWRTLRQKILARDLYRCQRSGCGLLLTGGRSDVRSAVVHHLSPHKGNLKLFYDPDNLQSVCWSCHSGDIQSEEVKGYDSSIGVDGWPVDPAHPMKK